MTAQREWFEKDYYKVLGVADTATAKEITKAYRKLARELHPDANPDNAAAEERFKEITAAYDVLGDDTKRKEYDEVRELGPIGRGGGPGGGGRAVSPSTPARPASATCSAICSVVADGPSPGQAPRRRRPAARRRCRGDADAELRGRGARARDRAASHRRAQCSTCGGSGAKPGTAPKVCARCAAGAASSTTTKASSRSPRRAGVQGSGVVIEDPCATCRGSGVEQRPREVKVRHARRRGRWAADPDQGPRWAGAQRRSGRRSVRRRARCGHTASSGATATT